MQMKAIRLSSCTLMVLRNAALSLASMQQTAVEDGGLKYRDPKTVELKAATNSIHVFDRFRNFVGLSASAIIFLAASAAAPAESLQQSAVQDGCLKYQDQKSVEPLKKFKHPALDKGCVACHVDCSSSAAANRAAAADHFLKAKEPALCLECHSPSKQDLSKAHGNQPLGNSRCSGCHDAHSSNFPKRIPEYMHGPYSAKLCSACHPAPVGGRVRLAAADVDTLCYECHAQFKMEMEGTRSRHKLLSQSNRACMECHDPHAASQEYVLKKPVQELCLGCHVEDMSKKSISSLRSVAASQRYEDSAFRYLNLSSQYIHEPVKKSCLICHDAHASEFPKELRVPTRDLCLDCHGENADKITHGNQPFPLFNGLVSLPPKTFEKVRQVDISGKYVHEPVNVSCALCHDAHASDYPKELYAPVYEVCLACHGSNAERIVRSEQPFPLFGGRVYLQPKTFETMMQIELIGGRFGHPTRKHPINAPATKDQPELSCSGCHKPHSASSGPKLLITDVESLCHRCHD